VSAPRRKKLQRKPAPAALGLVPEVMVQETSELWIASRVRPWSEEEMNV
jgi:hypothetical protein